MKNNTESMIHAAILQQQEEVRQRLSAVPEETPSPELEACLAGLQKKMVRRQFFNNIGRVSACLLGAVVICFGLLFAFKPTVRAAFVRWVKEIYENTIVYRFYGKPDEEYHMPDIVPGWLPEGMVLIQEDFVPDSSCTRVYENAETGKLIVFGYNIVTEMSNATISELEDYEHELLEVDGNQIEHFYIGEDDHTLWWFTDDDQLMVFVDCYLKTEEMLRFIKKLAYNY